MYRYSNLDTKFWLRCFTEEISISSSNSNNNYTTTATTTNTVTNDDDNNNNINIQTTRHCQSGDAQSQEGFLASTYNQTRTMA